MQDKILNTAEIYHYLIDKLYYDQGSFYKKNSDGTLKSIGSLDPSGYMRMWIKSKLYYVHRLVWLLFNKDWPSDQIDHINGVRTDNRIDNLRMATHDQNMQNRKSAHSNSLTGVLGVSFTGTSYRARIYKNNKTICIGNYSTLQEASEAYLNAKRNLHEFYPD